MTTPTQGKHTQPEALRLANALYDGSYLLSVERYTTADELRRLHAYAQELESQVIADCMTHDAQPAAPQGVAYAKLPEPIWRTAQGVAFSARQLYDFADRTHALCASHGQAPAGATQWAYSEIDTRIKELMAGTAHPESMSVAQAMKQLVNELWQQYGHTPTAQPTLAAHVQKPAEIEHVEGDVSKNLGESNMEQHPAPSAAAAPDDWKIPQPEVGGSAVPVTQEDVDAAREKVLWCLGSALLSGSDREARKALNDRHALYSLLGDANCRLVGSIAPRPSPTPQADSVLEDAARLDWLALAGPTSICTVIDRPHDGEVEVSTDDVTGYGKTLREAIDAARKQGGA